jgi:hypothetical protein
VPAMTYFYSTAVEISPMSSDCFCPKRIHKSKHFQIKLRQTACVWHVSFCLGRTLLLIYSIAFFLVSVAVHTGP